MTPAQFNGQPCNGSSSEILACNTIPCSCTWNNWTEWTSCNASCGGGVQYRTRTQIKTQNNDTACIGPDNEYISCNSVPCQTPVSPVPFSVYEVVSFNLISNQTQTLTNEELALILETIISGALNVDPKYIQVNLISQQSGFHVEVYIVDYQNDTFPISNPGQSIADVLQTTNVQTAIQQQTSTNLDPTSIALEGTPNSAPNTTDMNTNILGVPLYVWVAVGGCLFLIIIIVILFIVIRAREMKKRPWQEFV